MNLSVPRQRLWHAIAQAPRCAEGCRAACCTQRTTSTVAAVTQTCVCPSLPPGEEMCVLGNVCMHATKAAGVCARVVGGRAPK